MKGICRFHESRHESIRSLTHQPMSPAAAAGFALDRLYLVEILQGEFNSTLPADKTRHDSPNECSLLIITQIYLRLWNYYSLLLLYNTLHYTILYYTIQNQGFRYA
jgi:hypothetical protein